MQLDVLFDPFGGRWDDLGEAAELAERQGFAGAWLYDHLAGSVHRAPHVLECWTTMTAIAATVPRIMVGSLVLNAANRDPATLAVAAATFQEVSGGRLLLGLGAGGGVGTPYAAEQRALGRPVPADADRRASVADAVATLRRVWTGTVDGTGGFLVPRPEPPVIVGGFGPKMAELAGRVGDGINAPGGPHLDRLVDVARAAHADAGRSPDDFVVTTSASPGAVDERRYGGIGVDRVILMARPPYVDAVRRLAATIR
jgi:alkanesulfonate monooxygenase SsuD/methylene tetrahydromethanopterin reductase-like flavin-dependent oxidoreductase (luciferase family)